MSDALFALAAPPCASCVQPVQSAEQAWHMDEDGAWRVRWFMVCAGGHRVLVRPFGGELAPPDA